MNRIRRVARRALVPYEDDDLVTLVAELEAGGRVTFDAVEAARTGKVLAYHGPNETRGPVQHHVTRRRKGVTKGWPDLVFVDAVVCRALEAKRATGGKVSDEQRACLAVLAAAGWETAVCAGLDAMRAQCRAWGYLP